MAAPFDTDGFIPPFMGVGARPEGRSPHPTTMVEVAKALGQTPERQKLLRGLIQYRELLRGHGLLGYQWIDGSFVTDVETHERRSPGDIDVVSFLILPPDQLVNDPEALGRMLHDHPGNRARFGCDAYVVQMNSDGQADISLTAYWLGLFSHTKPEHKFPNKWKGLLQVNLSADPMDDRQALAHLGGEP